MLYTLIITCAPASNNANNALSFARAIIDKGHTLFRLFFYGEGVHIANACSVATQGEHHIQSEWQVFIDTNQLDSVVCIAAGLKHGILNKAESSRYHKTGPTLLAPHDLSGLGQLAEATQYSDRVVTFN